MPGVGVRRMAVGIALLAVLTGCSSPVAGVAAPDPAALASRSPATTVAAPTPTGPLFTDVAGRFALAPPDGWTVDTSGLQNTAVIFLDPEPTSSDAGAFSANINVLVSGDPTVVDPTVLGARRVLLTLTDYDSTVDEPFTLDDGTPAYILGGTFTDVGSGFDLRNLQVFTVVDGATVVVTGTALTDTWTQYATTFDISLRTLTVTG